MGAGLGPAQVEVWVGLGRAETERSVECQYRNSKDLVRQQAAGRQGWAYSQGSQEPTAPMHADGEQVFCLRISPSLEACSVGLLAAAAGEYGTCGCGGATPGQLSTHGG